MDTPANMLLLGRYADASTANRKGIELLRSENDQMRTRLTVNLKAVEEGKKPDVALKANDIVIVPRRIF